MAVFDVITSIYEPKVACACGHVHDPEDVGIVAGYVICACSDDCYERVVASSRLPDQRLEATGQDRKGGSI